MRMCLRRASGFAVTLGLLTATIALAPSAVSASDTPLWVKHVRNYPGGISGGVRARLVALETESGSASASALQPVGGTDLQMNDDCDPALPQNETSVAVNVSDPSNAVAAANDYCGDGFWIGHTTDGGGTWISEFKDPKLSPDSLTLAQRRCFGSDPSVVYSRADAAFYLATLCYSPSNPSSEVQVWKSTNGGATWTDSLNAAHAITNIAPDGTIDGTVFYDKELLAVDNNPASAHYGRLYLTFIKFHMTLPSGRSDYCPVQLAYTDPDGTAPDAWSWSHTAVVPDAPGANGVGPSANQWAMPVVDETGGLDIAYALEECNTGYDPALYFTRSTNGGGGFSTPVRIDKPGQFADNPSRQDLLPAKHAGIAISPSLAFDPVGNRLLFAYQNNIDRGTTGADVSIQTSDDFGASWSDAAPVAVTPSGDPAPHDQFFPWLTIDDTTGDAYAIWYDNRNDAGNRLIETFVGVSTDGGETWDNELVSDVAWDPNDSFFSCGCFLGDYNAIALGGSLLYPVWTDGRNSDGPPLGQADIFTDVMSLT
jgi:hypothetical protein